MKHIYFLVEGQTEERFVKDVLAGSPVFPSEVFTLTPILVRTGKSGARIAKGGVTTFGRFEQDLNRLLNGGTPPNAVVTTLIDLYRLPKDFPGNNQPPPQSETGAEKADRLEQALKAQFRDLKRFIPYIQVYEFEALLFADVTAFGELPPDDAKSKTDRLNRLGQILREFDEKPETINSDTPPSKRILEMIPAYDKVKHGSTLALAIGLEKMQRLCPRFSNWLHQLTQAGAALPSS